MRPVMLAWLRTIMLGFVGVLGAGGPYVALGQPNPNGAEAVSDPWKTDPVLKSWANQPGVALCFDCHYAPVQTPILDISFSRRNELQFWLANDKHAIARRRVEPLTQDDMLKEVDDLKDLFELSGVPADWFGASNVLSRRICDKLGYDVKSPEGYAMFRNNCLTCHGGYQGEANNHDFAKDGGAQPGISCNYCHQSEANTAWIQQHGVQGPDKRWRNSPPAEKTTAGMRDLVNVATQAATCYDCHVGNRDKDMFVTHVMYAAGHPPLPGIELQTYCSSMPQHWQSESVVYQSLERVRAGDGDKYFKINNPTLPAKTMFWNTRKMLVGALAARLHNVQLLIDSSTPERWADYSLYDCAACHHELREPSTRQARGYAGAPGRPRQLEWPEAILSVGLEVAGLETKTNVDANEKKLAAAFARTPFGEPAVVAPLATELRTLLQTAIERAQARPLTANVSRKVLRRLAITPKANLLVYDSARQIVWAIQAITAELASAGEPLSAALSDKIALLGNPKSTGIEATLPAGRQVFIYPVNLNAELQRKAAYSPEKLAIQLTEIATDITAEIVYKPTMPAIASR